MSRYSTKVVYFFLLNYVHGEWEKYAAEVREFHVEITNFTASCTMELRAVVVK